MKQDTFTDYAMTQSDLLYQQLGDLQNLDEVIDHLATLPTSAVATLLGEMLHNVFCERGFHKPRYMALLMLQRISSCDCNELDRFLELVRL
jgi:hypothetical protein